MLDTQSISDAETEEKIGESPQRTLPRRLLLGALTVLFLASLALLIGFGLGKYREHTAVASQRLQVTVLNVGHGEATWIQTPGGKFILVGSGPPEAGELVVASLRRAGAQQIDLLVLPYPYAESIGGVASVICYFFVALVKPMVGYDDALDVFGVHGIGGVWGAIATGIFALPGFGVDKLGGWYYGNFPQMILKFKAIAFTVVYSAVATFVILMIIKVVMGLRTSQDGEIVGLDLTDHALPAYSDH